MMPFRSLKGLTFAFLTLFLAATTLTGLALYISNTASIERLVEKRIATVSTLVAPPGIEVSRAEIERRIELLSSERDTGDIGFLLSDAAGRRLAGNIAPSRLMGAGYADVGAKDGIEGLSHGRAYTRELADGLFLSTIAETEPFDRYREERRRAYLIGFGSIILIVIAGLITFGRIVRGRILAMRRTVDAIIDGDMRQRVPVDHSGSEFDQQAIAFNRMLDRIEGLMEGLGTISNEIAHDLRTPLARLRTRLSRVAQRQDAAPVREEIGAAIEQSDEILRMFESVLRIVEVEGGARRAAFERLDVHALAADMVVTMEPVASEWREHRSGVRGPGRREQAGRQPLREAAVNIAICFRTSIFRPAGCWSDGMLIAKRTPPDRIRSNSLAEKRNVSRRFGRRRVSRTLDPMRSAVLYARVSTPEQQREGYSIPAQIQLLEDYADMNGIQIVSQYVDVETARPPPWHASQQH